MFFENLNALCAERREKITPVLDKLGIGKGAIARWRNGGLPNSKSLKIIADYFEVTTDYLLKGESNMSDAQEKMLAFSKSDETTILQAMHICITHLRNEFRTLSDVHFFVKLADIMGITSNDRALRVYSCDIIPSNGEFDCLAKEVMSNGFLPITSNEREIIEKARRIYNADYRAGCEAELSVALCAARSGENQDANSPEFVDTVMSRADVKQLEEAENEAEKPGDF